MIKGTGIDLVNINRIEHMITKWQERFLDRVFTKREQIYCEQYSDAACHFAARFAAKEAVLKMLAANLEQLNWQEIEIINNDSGKPRVKLRGKAQKLLKAKKIKQIHLSLSHEKDYAAAQVIGEGS